MRFTIYAGVTHIGGDMFKSIPSGDAIFMKVKCWKLNYNFPTLKCYQEFP